MFQAQTLKLFWENWDFPSPTPKKSIFDQIWVEILIRGLIWNLVLYKFKSRTSFTVHKTLSFSCTLIYDISKWLQGHCFSYYSNKNNYNWMCMEYGPSKKHILQPLFKKWPCFTRVTMTTGEIFWKFLPKNENSLQAPSFHVWFSYERNEHMSGTKPWKSHEYWPDVIYFWHCPFDLSLISTRHYVH